MSFRWPTKDPDERLDYSVDWERFLQGATISEVTWFVKTSLYNVKTEIEDGETLTTASGNGADPTVGVADTIQNVSTTIATNAAGNQTIATINIEGGQNNVEYTFFCQMRDSTGSIAERSIKLRVKER